MEDSDENKRQRKVERQGDGGVSQIADIWEDPPGRRDNINIP
jgi:hypothetical protein